MTPFVSDCGGWPVTADDESIVIERHQLLLNGIKNLSVRSAPQVRAANALLEKGVASKKNVLLSCEMETCTAGCVSWRVQDPKFHAMTGNRAAVVKQAIDNASPGTRHSDPLGLHIEFIKEEDIRFVNRGRRSASLLKIVNRSNVIDMRVSADNLPGRESVFLEPLKYLLWIVSRIDHDGLARVLVRDDRAVALEQSDWKCLDDHASSIPPSLPRSLA